MGKSKKSKIPKKWSKGNPWQEKSPVKAKKYLGQHFLKDEEIASRIANTLSMEGYQKRHRNWPRDRGTHQIPAFP